MRILALLLILTFAPAEARAIELAATDRSAIRDVVAAQLDAFQRDDGAAAFGYASPSIRELFRTAEGFMAMVREGYAPVYRPRRVDFAEIVEFRGYPTQRVRLVGPDGVPVIANYLMERQPDGTWRIDGVILEEVEDLGV